MIWRLFINIDLTFSLGHTFLIAFPEWLTQKNVRFWVIKKHLCKSVL